MLNGPGSLKSLEGIQKYVKPGTIFEKQGKHYLAVSTPEKFQTTQESGVSLLYTPLPVDRLYIGSEAPSLNIMM